MSEKVYSNKTAQDLFPALFKEVDVNKSLKTKSPESTRSKKFSHSAPPRPPDLHILRKKFVIEKSDTETGLRRALVLSAINDSLLVYKKVLQDLKFTVELATSEIAAIESISMKSFSTLIYENSLEYTDFEQFMRNLAGDKRRNLYYVVIGAELSTLYYLQALCLSANLVVNSKDVQYLEKILRKGFKDYEALYRPFIEILETRKE